MELLNFKLSSTHAAQAEHNMICGVVGSGNLEVLVSPLQDHQTCEISVNTSATGFQTVWHAVLTEFCNRHAVGGLKFQLNDMGATPAVVSLRLSQAVAMLKDGEHA
ncbi:malonate decarboxylase acyl carrier protein [Acinetobacter wuhouensis]|uniref:malonate decarboxylase acyl carrier protein n=1 Tax=Acinetobacter TaxID=469 RepID=UPI00083B763B|nr:MULTISPECIES: malonate decarboxylase acyl carrier protein [Acinetobacter]AXQ23885.1 malonate decarboxylase acyl carrier protein [Acinetobacter wuhouensis]RZG76925.1 malonate decarboxylase acyl carrier protein [Acinetobacter sp. WCHAc060025]RZG87037.1 malonate decarboxylase acyl carrier protein [Acinetobacter sp. WCHAc060033]